MKWPVLAAAGDWRSRVLIKVQDIANYQVDIFVIGDDWKGKFDYLQSNKVDVIYLSRTPEISTTQIKHDLSLKSDEGAFLHDI